ncbi:MAG TPA: dTDP-4-dehydrorhamnose reductase [Planctomycetota bacterium]|nr:dTDP-4-dehydrorhamnose reductase [Planctomycetota bacterium]
MSGIDYLVTGAMGQLGRAVVELATRRGRHVVGVDLAEMPLEDRAAIVRVVAAERPRFVVHCGAITNVDGCEADALAAFRINGLSTAWVAEAAARASAGVIYVSTDFVFDGAAQTPYAVDAAPKPLSVYGASKRLGEEAVLAHGRADFFVVRTSWVFGPGGKNFPRAILDRARSGQPLTVVTDQVGRPTMTHDLAEALLDLAESKAEAGIYHAANEGHCSWHQFAVDILREAGLGSVAVGTQKGADLKRPAARPAWSVLDTSKLAAVRGKLLPHYTDALRRHLQLDAAARAAAAPAAGDSTPGAGGPLRGKQY